MLSSPNKPSLEQISYALAYEVLPHYAFKRISEIRNSSRPGLRFGGPYFYILTLKLCFQMNPGNDDEHAAKYLWHRAQRSDGTLIHVLEYPVPPCVAHVTEEQWLERVHDNVLAPHFSAIVDADTDPRYFILGQRPLGGTTLREVTGDGRNYNLGEGPAANLADFVQAVKSRMST